MLSTDPTNPSLEQLLRRKDIWRGHSQAFVDAECVDSGYSELNRVLLHRGWPLGCVVEVCQSYHASEWCLFHPATVKLLERHKGRYLVLLNPPALPFISALAGLGIASQRIVVVQSTNNQEFVSAFIELCRSQACALVMAWQPKRALSYTHLRKMQLACAEQHGLYILFRHSQAKLQSSPASLRLLAQPQKDSLHIYIFKQKGKLNTADIPLAIPTSWEKLPAHHALGETFVEQEEKSTGTANYSAKRKGRLVKFPKVSSHPGDKP